MGKFTQEKVTSSNGRKGSGGSAIKRMKSALKTAGLIGPESKVRKVGKNQSKKAQVAAASAHQNAKTLLRSMAAASKESNPFEMKFTKLKHEVIGKKTKGVTGRPGQTKKKSEDIRQKTLLVEMKNRNRESALVDRRIGENDPNMSVEDKMLERFMREKTKRSGNSTMFNLETEEQELTHMGKSLSSFDAFDDAGFEKVDDSDDDGNIDAKIVKYTHFGGFEDDKTDPEARKSRSEIMKEVMAKSKMHKRERQRQKEIDMEVQDSLDADLEEIRGMLAPMQDRPITEGKMVISNERKVENDVEFNPPSAVKLDDDYDKFVRELAYDRRAKPTDRIKNEDELAQEEKKRLEKLEQERLRRMKGDDSENDTAKTKSGKKRAAQADDLGDDDYTEHVDSTVSREAEMALTYKNGELINEKIFMSKRADSSSESDDEDDLSQDEDDDEDEDEDEDENQDEDGDQNITKLSKTRVQSNRDASVEPDISKASDTIATTEDQDNEQVPYVLVAPESIEDLLTLLDGKSATYQQTAIKRLRILNNVRLGSECKQNLSRLSMLLLDYRDHVVSLSPPNIALLKVLEGHTVELGRLFSAQTAEYSLQRITAIQGALVKSMSAGSKKHTGFPNLADLYFFRIVGEVFCTSDMQHTVVTPTILLMSQFLGQCPISTAQDAMSGLFLCEIFSEYFALSKRFVPEVANFLHRLCASCLGVKDAIILSMIPLPSMMNSILSIKDFSAEPATLCVSSMPLFSKAKNLSESVKIALLTEAFHLLSKCSRLWNETGSSIEIFAPTMLLFEKIPKAELAERSQQMIHSAHSNIKSQILSAGLKRRPLQLQKRKAIPIATYVPRFEDGYSHDRRYDPDRDRAERSKMQSELKQERRGAERELRKDAAFVARQQLQEIKEKDAAYKKKMDKIMGQLASQEGAMRGVERANKKPRQRR
ncbi:hypothetical protein BATDEDRAFT_11405 [Batrachochytrium dendrobatidis JAM81]|uniref:Nop14-like protein n=1 Tax=Batrachochytrium dendrobatidis (strain JAM81 / FGSC 10211) TaxID=684364 RepID=F4P3J8_BATDJ|nr:uncharacterized protein BATDEDRAFT_11405 [Batrachochytrium dendrobatidis JAM81]EGF80455.1 hypothetical protein BATDEDRAFT_11405 [Batrachochytrium dendrobatidis JAM81]|eukprot:XP_006678849.1 hypothetical protein BATDEDRAFT_11405 [Batrachochytrium dendrobatidis JAM81]